MNPWPAIQAHLDAKDIITQLGDAMRIILTMRFLGKGRIADIASDTGLSDRMVRKAIRSAVRLLRNRLLESE